MQARRKKERQQQLTEEAEREKAYLNDKVINLELAVEEQATKIRELTRLSYALGDQLDVKRKKGGVTSDSPQNISYSYSEDALWDEEELDWTSVDYSDEGVLLGSVNAYLGSAAPSTAVHESYHLYGRHNPPIRKGVITDAVNFFLDGCPDN